MGTSARDADLEHVNLGGIGPYDVGLGWWWCLSCFLIFECGVNIVIDDI